MSVWDKAQDLAAMASISVALYGAVAATTTAELQTATIDNAAHSIQAQNEQSTSQAISEATTSAGDTSTSQAK